MKDEQKLKKELITELKSLRRKVNKLEKVNIKKRSITNKGNGKNTSHKKRTDDSINRYIKNYSALIQKIQAAVVVHKADTRIMICNPAAENLLGLTKKELINKTGNDSVWHFFRDDHSIMPVEEYPVNKVLSTCQSIKNKITGIHRPSKENDIWVLVYADPVFNKKRKISHVIVTFIDITEQKQIEEILRKSEKRYQKAQEIGHVGSWEYNLQTTFFWGSDEAKRIYGFDINSKTFSTDDVENCIPERVRVHQALIDLIEKNKDYDLEFEIISNDLKQRKTIISKADIERDKNGNPLKITGVIQDITDRKQVEEALRTSEQRYHTVFENSPIPIWEEDFSEVKLFFDKLKTEGIKNLEEYFLHHPEAVQKCINLTKIVDVNRAALSMHNAKSKNELLKGLIKTFTPESLKIFSQELIGLWNGETEMQKDSLIKTLTGNERNVTVYYSICRGYEKTLSKVLVSIIDITERKQAEKVIFESERRFKNLANLLPQTIYETDINGKITFANETALSTFGYSIDDLSAGIYAIDMISEKDKKEGLQNIQRLLNNLTPNKNEYEMIKKDGTSFPALAFSAPIIRDGKVVGIRGTIVDITQRKKTENELRKLSEAVEQSPASIVITDLNGNIEYVNKTFENTTGYTFEEAINQNPRVLKSGYMSKEVYKTLWDTITSGNTWRGELFNKKKDGTFYWEDATICPIKDKENKIINYLAVKKDITDKKQITEELIKAKERAEKSDKLKTEFLAQMSHEIRSPLNITLNMLMLIKEELGEQLTEQISEYFTSVFSAGKRLVRTVELMINAAEMQIGSYEPVWSDVNLELDILSPVIKEYCDQVKEKGLEIILNKEIEIPILSLDKYSVYQIFYNLIDNAVKYTQRGRIEIIIGYNINNNIYVTVSDTGIGIAEEFMERLFEPFMQEERGYSRRYEGNGLGLSLVKKYCDLNNASINVESEKGKGSKFTISFSTK